MTTWTWPNSYVTRVVDGDTFVARVSRDLGFHGTATFEQRMRLNRINAKPAKTSEGIKATAALETLAMAGPVLIATVGAYKYGDEWMAEITLPDGRNVSDAMVANGFAVFWDGTGPRPD